MEQGIPSPFFDKNLREKSKVQFDGILEGPGISAADEKEIFDFLEKKTGKKGFILVLCDDTMPCSDEKAGKPCQGHASEVLNHGIRPEYVRACLEMILEVAAKYDR